MKTDVEWVHKIRNVRIGIVVAIGVVEILLHDAVARWAVAVIALLGIAFAFLIRRLRKNDEAELSILKPPR